MILQTAVQAELSFVSPDTSKMAFFHEQMNKSCEQMLFKQTTMITYTIKNAFSCVKCIACNCWNKYYSLTCLPNFYL